MIDVQGLSKNYGAIKAVDNISFHVNEGELFAFLGTNGAGKTTVIEMMCTALKKDAGEVTIAGHTLGKHNDAIRKNIGIVFQQSLLDDRLTVYENIMSRGKLYNLTKTKLTENYEFVRRYLSLDEIEKRRYSKLSGGQRRRADIARALIHQPRILFLDEPTTGLDPQTRAFVWKTIRKLQQEEGITVFLTTHYMEEAAAANMIAVMHRGSIVARGTVTELKARYARDSLTLYFINDTEGENWLRERHQFTVTNGGYRIDIASTLDAVAIVNDIKPLLQSYEVTKGTMDDVFIRINEEEQL